MRAITVLICLFTIICADPRVCNITCEPEDEFEDPENPSEEWSTLMELIDAYFSSPYEAQCNNNQEQQIDTSSIYEELWHIRYEIYDERQNPDEKTLNDCYCDYQGEECKGEEFRQCMASARVAMLADFIALYTTRIPPMIEDLKDQC